MWCFSDFHFQTRLVPQPCALFWHLKFQKCSKSESFHGWQFWLAKVLLATAPTFWTSLLPKAVRVLTHFQMCFGPQRSAIIALLFRQRSPRPPLYGGYLSTIPEHETIEKDIILHNSLSILYIIFLFSICIFLCIIFFSLPLSSPPTSLLRDLLQLSISQSFDS